MSLRFFNILALMTVLSCTTVLYDSQAQESLTLVNAPPLNAPPLNAKVQYECRLSGVLIGKMGVEAEQTPGRYAITSDIISSGLLKLFVHHTSHTTVISTGNRFIYPAIDYETHYQTRKKKKYVHMVHKDGILSEETLIPPDNRATRPAVPDELKKDVANPLTFILKMRQGLFEALQAHNLTFSTNVYDGRRLTKVDFTILGRQELKTENGNVPVIAANIKRTFVAGFTASELEDKDPDEPLRVYFSDDERLLPVRLEIRLWMGTLSASLSKTCSKEESCLLGISGAD